jgi:hypothetical protein
MECQMSSLREHWGMGQKSYRAISLRISETVVKMIVFVVQRYQCMVEWMHYGRMYLMVWIRWIAVVLTQQLELVGSECL